MAKCMNIYLSFIFLISNRNIIQTENCVSKQAEETELRYQSF